MRSLLTIAAALFLTLPIVSRAADPMPAMNVVATAEAAGQFTTLVAALKAAGLDGTLEGSGPFTVFAPTDAAFAKLPAGTVESLLKPENKKKLTAILLYHVVSGNVKAAKVATMTSVKTLNGQYLTISTSAGGVKVDGSTVVTADIAASNGTIHVIDAVLMPK
jgi:uncharacterized surface protein with fasciclin (FAS1) repeats